ncbi:hypothetical protein CT694_35635 (plasmid) [Bacillus wiedmannii bv. thuringiensis]|nr:hypothetical protein CT694_35635 [Bacillus wiedmannii bv. thuringiensis]
MIEDNKNFTSIERNWKEQIGHVTDQEFEEMIKMFEDLPYESFRMSDEDKKKVKKLLPNLDMSKVENSQVKCTDGICECGRKMNMFDTVKKALSGGMHSTHFLVRIFNGSEGKMVVSSTEASEELRSMFPTNTLFVEEATPIPCANCNKEHELILLTDTMLHYWVT